MRLAVPMFSCSTWRLAALLAAWASTVTGRVSSGIQGGSSEIQHASAIWVYDYRHRRMSLLDLLSDGSPSQEIRLTAAAYLFQPVMMPGRIVSNGYFGRHTLTVLDPAAESGVHYSAGVPAPDTIPPSMFRINFNRNRAAVDPGHRRLALAYQAVNRIDIFDSIGQWRGSSRGPIDVQLKFRRARGAAGPAFVIDDLTEIAYVAADGSRDHVFALFCGPCARQREGATAIHVFTWDGVFVAELRLDLAVSTVSVSGDGSLLLGAVDYPFPRIVVWELNRSWFGLEGKQ